MEEGGHTFIFCGLGVRFLYFFVYGGGVSYTARRERSLASTYPLLNEEVVEGLVGWLGLFLCLLGDVVVEELPGNGW